VLTRWYRTGVIYSLDVGLFQDSTTMLGGDRRRIELAYSLQLTTPGTPVIRYGEDRHG
jgi:maltose alpha-D-glucosyltransferase/alpha-amylase